MRLSAIGEWLKEAWAYLAALIGIAGAIYKYIILPAYKRRQKRFSDQEKTRNQILESITQITTDIRELTTDVAFLQHDRLQQGHDYFMRKGFCPAMDKHNLIGLYDRYTSKGRNSLYESYKDDLLDLPEHEPGTGWGARQ